MTLQSSGTIRMSQINTELGRSSTATISLDTAENGGYGAINTNSTSRPSSNNPAAISEWYSYNHNASPSLTYTYDSLAYYSDPCSGATPLYYGSNGRWYRSANGLDFTDVTDTYITYYYNEDAGFYVYLVYYVREGFKDYYGEFYSYCAPF